LLKDNEETDNLFTDFPIGATIQDGGKRKRSTEYCIYTSVSKNYILDLIISFIPYQLSFIIYYSLLFSWTCNISTVIKTVVRIIVEKRIVKRIL